MSEGGDQRAILKSSRDVSAAVSQVLFEEFGNFAGYCLLGATTTLHKQIHMVVAFGEFWFQVFTNPVFYCTISPCQISFRLEEVDI